MPVVTFRGIRIREVRHSRDDDQYILIGADGILVACLKAREYHAQPQLKILGVSNGRHRRSDPKVHRGPAGKSSANVANRALRQAGAIALPSTRALAKSLNAYAYRVTAIPAATWRAINAGPQGPGVSAIVPIPAGGPWTVEDRKIEDAGIRAGEVIGIRGWRIIGDRLFSVYMNDCEWMPNEPIESINDQMGVFAFKSVAQAQRYVLMHGLNPTLAQMEQWMWDMICFGRAEMRIEYVIGTVAMWGWIVEHEGGWRGEFAKIKSLDQIESVVGKHDQDRILERLRKRYGVP